MSNYGRNAIAAMGERLDSLLKELERFGVENDARTTDHEEKLLNITAETGAFLTLLVQAVKARRVLEIGTSNGYSTLWLADAVRRLGGGVLTVEVVADKAEMARANFERAELLPWIRLHLGDAGEFLRGQDEASQDFLFLDSDREEYVTWWPDLRRILSPGGLIIVDNATSHAVELESFLRLVQDTPGYTTSLVPLGNGELLVLKENQ